MKNKIRNEEQAEALKAAFNEFWQTEIAQRLSNLGVPTNQWPAIADIAWFTFKHGK